MKDNSSGIAGFLAASIDNIRTQKAMKAINNANIANRGIIYYKPSQIEAFFDDMEPLENMIISGGSNGIRIRAISRVVECAYIQGYSTIVIHCSNNELEHYINSYFGINNVCTVNRNNPVYDPLVGASNGEISRLIISSSEKNSKINAAGRYYIAGISDYIRANKKSPRCYMFINCPHLTFLDSVNNAEMKGKITPDEAKRIVSQIMQGEIERGNIEDFFQKLSLQSGSILASKNNAANAINFNIISNNQQILLVDIQSNSNVLLVNLLINEIDAILSQGKKVFIVLDGISLGSSDVLLDNIKRGGGNCSFVISADDVYSCFGGVDNDFFAFVGKSSKIIISRHLSAYSCSKIADTFGSYDKQEVNNTYSRNTNYIGNWGYGTTQTANVNIKRENIVNSEEIQRMLTNEVYIYDKLTGEISNTQVV